MGCCDLGKPACMITRKRLVDSGQSPSCIGHRRLSDGTDALPRWAQNSALATLQALFCPASIGALPLAPENNPNRNLGCVHGGKTLVFVDSPNKMTGLTTLRRAITLRDTHMGGWDKVVVLGWNFSSSSRSRYPGAQ